MKLAFVIPWFGFEIAGGAESHCREMVVHLKQRGYETEVLTTCVRELASDWNENYHQPGTYVERGITVRRFPVDCGNHAVFVPLNQKLLCGQELTDAEEIAFMREGVNSSALLRFIEEHRSEYFFFFMPYLFGTTFWGSQIAPERSILIPCLHDEPYARMRVMRSMFEKVRGIIFNSPAERALAEALFDLDGVHVGLLGEGVENTGRTPCAPTDTCPVKRPFILYVGRKDPGKNVDLLISFFEVYKRRQPSNLKLVLIGSGQVGLYEHCLDLGFVTSQEKHDLFAAAQVVCQPSVKESFSKAIMESWLYETPVLVHGECAVTRDHVERSRGGLYFSDYYEFEACLDYLLKNDGRAREMGKLGRRYVLANYTWERVMDRFDVWFRETAKAQRREVYL